MRKYNLFGLLAAILIASLLFSGCAAPGGAKSEFTRTTIDVGIVVSDVEKAAEFYKNALGFSEVPGFDVSAEMGAGSGLTNYQPFHVRVMVLGEEPTATKIKLMEFANRSTSCKIQEKTPDITNSLSQIETKLGYFIGCVAQYSQNTR